MSKIGLKIIVKPEPMKKYQLLEKAMRDYPAGTVARFASAPNVDHTSDGIFHIFEQLDDDNEKWELSVLCGNSSCVYTNGEWAIPVHASILTGKCAIQVNNDREFKLLMEHYEGKGWLWQDGDDTTWIPREVLSKEFPLYISYEERFFYRTLNDFVAYTIITFAEFAKEVGVTVPVYVMKSEDGVDLYIGDGFYSSTRTGASSSWYLNAHDEDENKNCFFFSAKYKNSLACAIPSHNKAFSTKEAAEKWIAEANKPKEIEVRGFGYPTFVTSESVLMKCGGSDLHEADLKLSSAELEAIYAAFKSLKQ